MFGTKNAAGLIHKSMKERTYSTEEWGKQELHPTLEEGFSDVGIVNFVFTMDLLNFSFVPQSPSLVFRNVDRLCRFWSTLSDSERFQVDYQGKRWIGYKSLLACLRRALDEGVPITTPCFWNHPRASDETLRKVFRSATDEEMPLLDQRIAMLREAGKELSEVCVHCWV